jgi:hypothetical protein
MVPGTMIDQDEDRQGTPELRCCFRPSAPAELSARANPTLARELTGSLRELLLLLHADFALFPCPDNGDRLLETNA